MDPFTFLATPFISAAGFGHAGVTASSLAAGMHSSIGSVAAGSPFAAAQSIGATTATGTVVASTLTWGIIIGGTIALICYHREIAETAQVIFQDENGYWKSGYVDATKGFSQIGNLINDPKFGQSIYNSGKFFQEKYGHAAGEAEKFFKDPSVQMTIMNFAQMSRERLHYVVTEAGKFATDPLVHKAAGDFFQGVSDGSRNIAQEASKLAKNPNVHEAAQSATTEAGKTFTNGWGMLSGWWRSQPRNLQEKEKTEEESGENIARINKL